MDSYRLWADLRSRMPMLYEDADRILESESEQRAEFGMGYVTGGGHVHDASLAWSQFGQTDKQALICAEARATIELHRPWHVPEFGPYVLDARDPGDFLPF